MKEIITKNFRESSLLIQQTGEMFSEKITQIAEQVIECYRRKCKVMIAGNGGSAADAQHISGELVNKFYHDREALSAIALSTDTSVITSWANDKHYDYVFERQIEAHLKKKKKEDIEMMLKRRENVLKTREALLKGDLKKFAELLNTEQKSKETLMKDILSQKANEIYHKALDYGAIAGKVSGAGSGGCVLFVYDNKDKNKFIKKMSELGCINLPIKIQRLNTMGEI